MSKLLRRNGKIVASVFAYESSNTKKPLGIVFVKKFTKKLPKTAKGFVWVKYFKEGSGHTHNTKRAIFVKASTARKMELQ